MESFIRNIPKTEQAQFHWIVKKAQERLGKAVCVDCLKNELPVSSIEELYELVSLVCADTGYWENRG